MSVRTISQPDNIFIGGATAPGALTRSDDCVLEMPLVDDLAEGQNLGFRSGIQAIELTDCGPFLEGFTPVARIVTNGWRGVLRIRREGREISGNIRLERAQPRLLIIG